MMHAEKERYAGREIEGGEKERGREGEGGTERKRSRAIESELSHERDGALASPR